MPNISGPKDGKGVVAKFNTHKTGAISQNSSVLIIVSVNNFYFYDQWFKAILEAAKAKFSKITILIVDAPNAYNLEADVQFSQKTPEERLNEALKLGELWWTKNQSAFQNNGDNALNNETADEQIATFNSIYKTEKPSLEIIRWNDWIQEKNFNFEEFRQLFATNRSLQLAVHANANSFADRQGLNSSHPNYLASIKGFEKYLIDESIGILLLMHKRGYSFVAYPDPILEALKQTYTILVSPKSNKTADEIWLQIDFKRVRTEAQKQVHLDQQFSKLKATSSSPSSDRSISSISPLSTTPAFNNQDEDLRRELEEMRAIQKQILLQQKKMELQLMQQAEVLKKLTQAQIRDRSDSAPSSSTDIPQPFAKTTYFFKPGSLRADFLAELELHNPVLKEKNATLNLFTTKTSSEKPKKQHNSFPAPSSSSL